MSVFETTRILPYTAPDLTPVENDVIEHVRIQGYETTKQATATGGRLISIVKGGTFQKVLGFQTALNIRVEPHPNGTLAAAGIGVFDQQVIPSLITVFIFWPVILAQIWGTVQQSNLDDEAINVIETSLQRHGTRVETSSVFAGASASAASTAGSSPSGGASTYDVPTYAGGTPGPSSTAGGTAYSSAAPSAAGSTASATTTKQCPACGTEMGIAAKFCPECGTRIGNEEAL